MFATVAAAEALICAFVTLTVRLELLINGLSSGVAQGTYRYCRDYFSAFFWGKKLICGNKHIHKLNKFYKKHWRWRWRKEIHIKRGKNTFYTNPLSPRACCTLMNLAVCRLSLQEINIQEVLM